MGLGMKCELFRALIAAAAKSLQSCPTLCDPIDGSPPGSPVPGILQARTLEWLAISFSKAWKWKVKVKSLSRVRLLAIPRTTAYQAPQPMGLSRQEYWSGVPLTPTKKHPPKKGPWTTKWTVSTLCLAQWACEWSSHSSRHRGCTEGQWHGLPLSRAHIGFASV